MRSKTTLRIGLGALLTALLLCPALAQQGLSITIARIGGTVEVQHATETKGAWVKAKKDQVIGSGWNLRTAAAAKAQLVFPQDNVVILKENSVLSVDKLDATGAKVNARSGGLLVDIKNALSPGSTFEVQTPTALAVVRGTKFGVEISTVPPGGGQGITANENPLAKESEWGSRVPEVDALAADGGDGLGIPDDEVDAVANPLAGNTGDDPHTPKRPGSRRVQFHGYEGTVEITNEHGTSRMTAGTSVSVDGGTAPSDALPSGDDAQDFLEDAEDSAVLDEFDAAAEAISSDLSPIRAALLDEDRKLSVIEGEWEGHVRKQDIGKLLLLFGQLEDFVQLNRDLEQQLWEALGEPGSLGSGADAMVEAMQEQGVPDTDLPPLLDDLNERIAELLVDIEPFLVGQQELLDRLQGLLEPGDPRGSIRHDLLDSDNDGIPDALELELGLDPLLSHRDGAIELIAPDDGDDYNFPPDSELIFEFEGLDTDTPLTYNLVLEAGGQQAVRRNVRERERFTLAQLAGPQGLLANAAGPSGELNVDWYIEAQLRQRRSGPPVEIRSERRSFTVSTPANQAVEVSLRGAGAARLGSPVIVIGDISEVQALAEWEIEIEYDPQYLQFTQGNRTGLFGGSTVFFNDAGSGRLVVSGQVPTGSTGLSGDGDIFSLSFTPLAAGDTEVEVRRVVLRDSLGREIDGRPGDSAELNIARGGSATPPSGPAGAPTVPGGPSVTPGSRPDSADLPGLGPVQLRSPSQGSSFSYPADSAIEFEFDELRANFDIVYNLIISSGGKSRKFTDYASGDPIQLAPLLGTGGIFAGAPSGGQPLELDWRIEAEVDMGGGAPLRYSSETWRVNIGGPRNGTVTLDLSALGKVRGIQVGDPVRVRGSLGSVEALGEFSFEIRFDAGVLDFDSGKRVGLFNSASVRVDNAGPGRVVVSGSAGGQGISGDGDVFELSFTARSDGMAVIEPGQITLRDILGGAISAGAGDEVEVEVDAKGRGGAGAPGAGGGGQNDPFAPR